jgi:serine phosphatase RsbU (regulator of sigma subunit)
MKGTERSSTAAVGDVGAQSAGARGERSFGPLFGGDWSTGNPLAQLERDLEIARDIQERLLPPSLPNLAGVEIGVALVAARVIGGDFYDFVPMPGGVGIALGDVSGKGIPAALLMVMTRTLFRAAAREADTPGAILAKVNRALCRDLPPNMFATMVVAVLTLGAGRRLSISNAGHVPPVLLRRGAEPMPLDVGGPIVGAFEDCIFDAQQIVLARGDLIVMCTDGVVENPGQARLADGVGELIARSRAGADLSARVLASMLLDEARRQRGGTLRDDATLLVLKA